MIIALMGFVLTVVVLVVGFFDSPRFYNCLSDGSYNSEFSFSFPVAEENKIDLNNASVDELLSLYGIGEVRAQAIIDYRNENGGFFTVDELIYVKGISPKIYENNKDFVTVGPYTEVNYENQS